MHKRPAEAGRPVVKCLQANDHNWTGAEPQVQPSPWDAARRFEQASNVRARDGLQMRGAERFLALALASTYALAARDAALSGVVQ